MALDKRDEMIIRLYAASAAQMSVLEILVRTLAEHAPATVVPMTAALARLEASADQWTMKGAAPETSMLHAQIYQEEVSAVSKGLRRTLGEKSGQPSK